MAPMHYNLLGRISFLIHEISSIVISHKERSFMFGFKYFFLVDPSAPLSSHARHKFQEVFQQKQGRYSDLPATKISEIMKSNSLDVRDLSAIILPL